MRVNYYSRASRLQPDQPLSKLPSPQTAPSRRTLGPSLGQSPLHPTQRCLSALFDLSSLLPPRPHLPPPPHYFHLHADTPINLCSLLSSTFPPRSFPSSPPSLTGRASRQHSPVSTHAIMSLAKSGWVEVRRQAEVVTQSGGGTTERRVGRVSIYHIEGSKGRRSSGGRHRPFRETSRSEIILARAHYPEGLLILS